MNDDDFDPDFLEHLLLPARQLARQSKDWSLMAPDRKIAYTLAVYIVLEYAFYNSFPEDIARVDIEPIAFNPVCLVLGRRASAEFLLAQINGKKIHRAIFRMICTNLAPYFGQTFSGEEASEDEYLAVIKQLKHIVFHVTETHKARETGVNLQIDMMLQILDATHWMWHIYLRQNPFIDTVIMKLCVERTISREEIVDLHDRLWVMPDKRAAL